MTPLNFRKYGDYLARHGMSEESIRSAVRYAGCVPGEVRAKRVTMGEYEFDVRTMDVMNHDGEVVDLVWLDGNKVNPPILET